MLPWIALDKQCSPNKSLQGDLGDLISVKDSVFSKHMHPSSHMTDLHNGCAANVMSQQNYVRSFGLSDA